MTKVRTTFLSIALVLTASVLLYISIMTFFADRRDASPSARNGLLDLRERPLSGHSAVRLDGEWEFIAGKLVEPSQFPDLQAEAMIVHVPSRWSAYQKDGQTVPPFSSATYRLRILLNEDDRELAIKTTNIRLSNLLFVNGQKTMSSGVPRADESYHAYNVPYVKSFYTDQPQLEIVMHVANFHLAMGGGIISSIYLGDEQSIRAISQSTVAYDWIMIAVFLTIGMFGLGYYWQIGRDTQLGIFALFCFSVALYRLTHGERLFSVIFPSMPYEWFQKFQYFSAAGIGLFLLLFYHHALRDLSNRHVVRFGTGTGLALTAALALPAPFSSVLNSWYFYYLLAVFAYAAFLSFATLLLRRSGALYLVLSSISLMSLFVTEFMDLTEGSSGFIHLHVLPFVYLISMVLYLAHQFAIGYQKTEKLNQQLVQHDRLKDEFLAKTSHEFRTPLHGIISIAESMLAAKENGQLTADQQQKLTLVSGVSRRLAGLVNDILLHAKLRQGEYSLERKPFELHSTVQLAADFCSHLIDKGVTIGHRIPPQACHVIGDEERVRQVLYNLIGNAAKFTKQGRIDIGYERRDGFVCVSISDTGPGIPPDKLAHIFEPFRQGDAHTAGTGLGLAIVKQLVELQGGELTAASELGIGSVFTFSLPAAPMMDEAAATAVRSVSGVAERTRSDSLPIVRTPLYVNRPGRPRLLLVDDDHLNLNTLMDSLEPDQYAVVAVDSGQQALQLLARDSSFSLVLLDIMMPGMSGYEVCRVIRETHSLVELPVLMLTAAILPEDVVAAFQSGANDFLHKPLDTAELKTRVRNLIMMKDAAEKSTGLELSFLQAQIKPHFIYNVLNSVLSLSYSDPEQSRTLLRNFSTFLRGSFVFKTENNAVPLSQELSLVQAYVEIEQARYPEQFHFKLDVEPQLEFMIPPLIIQPLVENAIRHGIDASLTRCRIAVHVRKERGRLQIVISDTGRGISEQQLHDIYRQTSETSGVGLHNIIKRIRKIAGALLNIDSEINRGTRISIEIPEFHNTRLLQGELPSAEGGHR